MVPSKSNASLTACYLECMRINEMRRQYLETWKRPSASTYEPIPFRVKP